MERNRAKMAFSIGVLLVLIGLGYAGYDAHEFWTIEVVALKERNAKLEQQARQKKEQLQKLKNFALNIEAIKVELRELNLQLETALEYMPRSFKLSSLLRQFNRLAQNSGLELGTFTPGKESKIPNDFYTSVPITFDLIGSFTQTLVFLDQLSRLKRIVNVEALDMKLKSGKQELGAYVVTTKATGRAYRFAN